MPFNKPITTADTAEQVTRKWHVRLDPAVCKTADLLRPKTWSSDHLLRNSDIVRVEATDGSYDFHLKVTVAHPNGVRTVTVALYKDVLPADIASATAAASVLKPTMVNGKMVPRIDRTDADGWRLIGWDNTPVNSGYANEAAATRAYEAFLAGHLIETVEECPPVDARTGEERVARAAPAADATPAPDLNLSFAKRKEIEDKAKKAARKQSDLDALKQRQAANETAKAQDTLV